MRQYEYHFLYANLRRKGYTKKQAVEELRNFRQIISKNKTRKKKQDSC